VTKYLVKALAATPEKMGQVLSLLADVKGVQIDFEKIEEAPHTHNDMSKSAGWSMTNSNTGKESHTDTVMNFMKSMTIPIVTTSAVKDEFVRVGKDRDAADGAIWNLFKQGRIRKTGKARYKLVPEKSRKASPSASKKEK
jgi:hypothetical protein